MLNQAINCKVKSYSEAEFTAVLLMVEVETPPLHEQPIPEEMPTPPPPNPPAQ